ncbi:2-dehydropantoate 2-reductase [Metabacillus malikii]|uniref:2-dehydropantoate 2-reductase n=1 Tax=Metabacillus malikii TaxID=1504265 RepID=A0ABT9ZG71_9BACI|nr:2-dehydropantoate 2-reductase [Metabacillus malikii]MDQ0231282.1 2-dehydropantoate 2-reductase [Metabacillus malikii]
MEIGIIGGGAIGLLYSYYLAKEHNVTLYTNREAQAQAIRQSGLTLLRNDESYTTNAVAATASRKYKEKLLIITLKQYQLNEIIASLKELSPRTILFLQNGMSHLSLIEDLNTHQILLGVSEHGAMRERDDVVRHSGIGVTKIANYRVLKQSQHESLLSRNIPNFQIINESDYKEMLIRKLAINATINPITTVLRINNGQLLENQYFYKILQTVYKEVHSALDLKEQKSYWEHIIKVCKLTAKNESSMYKDIQRGKKTEIDAILGYIIDCANKRQLDIPTIMFLFQAIKGMENGDSISLHT